MEPIKLICEIVKRELGLSNGQVVIYNQKWNIPNDFKLYIVAEEQGQKVIANVRREVPTAQGLNEEQFLVSMAVMVLDVFSRGPLARTKKDEVIMALNSTYSQQVQEANGFNIARNSFQVTNTSEVEGTAELNRYSISFNVTYKSESVKSIDYFDTFTKSVITEK